jgi:hypothetical protein
MMNDVSVTPRQSARSPLQHDARWAPATCLPIVPVLMEREHGAAKRTLRPAVFERSSASHGHRVFLPPHHPRAAASAGTRMTRTCSLLRSPPRTRGLRRLPRSLHLPRGPCPRARFGLHHRRRPGPPPEGNLPSNVGEWFTIVTQAPSV